MGIDLTSESGAELRLSGIGWAFYLKLAELYGWRPLGTVQPAAFTGAEWSGRYDSSDGQQVRDVDAHALADALDSALLDPGRPERELNLAGKMTEDLARLTGRSVAVHPPEDDALLREFMAFCRRGGFRIE